LGRIRKIERSPKSGRNYYVVDACFLVNKYIPPECAPNDRERERIVKCREWWQEIDSQIDARKARVYIPDICIAESFKTLAKKYFVDHWFSSATQLNSAKIRMRRDIVVSPRTLRSLRREVRYHDISTSRDIIISVDRFFEHFLKKNLKVSLADLIILATAKYLMDFYDLPKKLLHIITLDNDLWKGSHKISELPRAYDPTRAVDAEVRVFF